MLYVLLFILALSGTSYAQGVKEPNMDSTFCWVQPTGQELWYPCGAEAAVQADCLQKMESAMKSVDPFMTDPSLALDLPAEEQTRIRNAWNLTKVTCWSNLKNVNKHYH